MRKAKDNRMFFDYPIVLPAIEKVSDVSGISYFSDFPSCANNLVRLIFILFS